MQKNVLPWMCAVLIGWMVIPALAAPALEVERTNIAMVQQDSMGVVWGTGSSRLYRWEDNHWQIVSGEGFPEGVPLTALTRGRDGAVYCLWKNSPDGHTLTRHQGDSSRQFAHFAGHLTDWARLFVDPAGNIWITEQGAHIYRVTPQGKAEGIYTIPANLLREEGPPGDNRLRCNPISAAADGRGRVWFWRGSHIDDCHRDLDSTALQGPKEARRARTKVDNVYPRTLSLLTRSK